MSAQLALDFAAARRARRDDPETSHEAAARVVDFSAGHFALILGSLKLQGPQTIYELAANTGLTHVQVARRLPEMADCERTAVVCTDERRQSPSGRGCRVWRLA